jgi:hypothetical protein
MSSIGPIELALGMPCLGGLLLALLGWIGWRICAKTGYSGALGLLMLVPVANLVLLLVLAFGSWPIEEELRRLRAGQSPAPPTPGVVPPGGDATPTRQA